MPISGTGSAQQTGFAGALSEALEHGLKTGKECLLTLDAETGKTVYSKVVGTAEKVTFPPDLVNLLQQAAEGSIVLVHNHSNSAAFSADDIERLADFKALKGLLLVGHDGTQYYVGTTTKTMGLNRMSLRVDYHRFMTLYFGKYQNLIAEDKVTKAEAMKEYSHQIMQALARKYGLEYVRWSRQ